MNSINNLSGINLVLCSLDDIFKFKNYIKNIYPNFKFYNINIYKNNIKNDIIITDKRTISYKNSVIFYNTPSLILSLPAKKIMFNGTPVFLFHTKKLSDNSKKLIFNNIPKKYNNIFISKNYFFNFNLILPTYIQFNKILSQNQFIFLKFIKYKIYKLQIIFIKNNNKLHSYIKNKSFYNNLIKKEYNIQFLLDNQININDTNSFNDNFLF